jgi:hypothetical protein
MVYMTTSLSFFFFEWCKYVYPNVNVNTVVGIMVLDCLLIFFLFGKGTFLSKV